MVHCFILHFPPVELCNHGCWSSCSVSGRARTGDRGTVGCSYPIKASSNRDALHALQWRRAGIVFFFLFSKKALIFPPLFLKVGSEQQREAEPSNRNLCVPLLIMLLALQNGGEGGVPVRKEVSWNLAVIC